MNWYMIRNCKTNVYRGPFDEERATKEAREESEMQKVDVEVIPLGNPAIMVRWTGVTVTDLRRGR